MIRAIVPDTHGSSVDEPAMRAALEDFRWLAPGEVVLLGDHVDVGGVFSAHPNNYVDDVEYSYEADCAAAARFLDGLQAACKGATTYYLEGNHEQRLERWVARTFASKRDAEKVRGLLAPEHALALRSRGIRYFRMGERHMGLSVPGMIKLGKCLFTHGARAGKYATAATLEDVGANVVHGHTHRAQQLVKRTVANGEIIGACPGTLSVLQPLYLHTQVSAWSHGYGLQLVERDGRFLHLNVPIVRGRSMLKPLLDQLRPRRKAA